MFGLFKKTEFQEEKTNELVAVNDLKQYVVDAYEKEKTLSSSIEQMKNEIKELKDKLKEAAIEKVVLDQKNDEVNRLESRVSQRERKIGLLEDSIDSLKNDLNTYRIKYRDTEKTIEDLKIQNKQETSNQVMIGRDKLKSNLMQQVEEHKGNLSKKIVLDLISNG